MKNRKMRIKAIVLTIIIVACICFLWMKLDANRLVTIKISVSPVEEDYVKAEDDAVKKAGDDSVKEDDKNNWVEIRNYVTEDSIWNAIVQGQKTDGWGELYSGHDGSLRMGIKNLKKTETVTFQCKRGQKGKLAFGSGNGKALAEILLEDGTHFYSLSGNNESNVILLYPSSLLSISIFFAVCLLSFSVTILISLFVNNQKELKAIRDYRNCFVVIMASLALASIIMLVLGSREQLDVFFARGVDPFGDFSFVYSRTTLRDPYNWSTGSLDWAGNLNYPPLAYLLLYPFSLFENTNTALVLGILFYFAFFILGMLIIHEHWENNSSAKKLMTMMFFFSGVFFASFERGNIIIVSAMLALFFLFEHDNKNAVIRELSYIALAFSAGIKIYPAIFGLLLIKKKRYKDALRLVIYGMLAFFLPFLFFKGGFQNIPLFIRNVGLFEEAYKYVTHDVFNFKYFASRMAASDFREMVYKIFPVVDKLLVVLGIVTSFLTKEKWKETLILSLCIIFSTIHSGFYMGLFFFAGIVLFLNQAEINISNSICFAGIIMILNPLQIEIGQLNLTSIMTNLGATIVFFTIIISTVNQTIRKRKELKGYRLT